MTGRKTKWLLVALTVLNLASYCYDAWFGTLDWRSFGNLFVACILTWYIILHYGVEYGNS